VIAMWVFEPTINRNRTVTIAMFSWLDSSQIFLNFEEQIINLQFWIIILSYSFLHNIIIALHVIVERK